MKLPSLLVVLAVGATTTLAITPAHAQSVTPCDVYTCMAGISGSGTTGGPGCAPALAYWHAPSPTGLAVWTTYGFVAPASATLRRTYLSTCPGANVATNAAILNAIISQWGSVP